MLSDFVKYVKQYWHDRPDKSTPLNADRLNHIENGIASNSEAINQIANAVVSNIVNDPEKIASMAAVYALQEKLGTGELPSDAPNAISAINTLYSNLTSKIIKTYYRNLTTDSDGLCNIQAKSGYTPIFAWVIYPTSSMQTYARIQYNPYSGQFFAKTPLYGILIAHTQPDVGAFWELYPEYQPCAETLFQSLILIS